MSERWNFGFHTSDQTISTGFLCGLDLDVGRNPIYVNTKSFFCRIHLSSKTVACDHNRLSETSSDLRCCKMKPSLKPDGNVSYNVTFFVQTILTLFSPIRTTHKYGKILNIFGISAVVISFHVRHRCVCLGWRCSAHALPCSDSSTQCEGGNNQSNDSTFILHNKLELLSAYIFLLLCICLKFQSIFFILLECQVVLHPSQRRERIAPTLSGKRSELSCQIREWCESK